jgi:hypothetical protein
MSENKSTGPRSSEGKEISSKNALKHGSTSKGFISDSERERFVNLLNELKQHYSSKNPLIHLQLDRIAKITVQLERIQDTIAASFEKSRAQTNIYKNLVAALDMTSNEESLLARKMLDIDTPINIIDNEKIAIANEVLIFKASPPYAQSDLLEKTPLFCGYLFRESALLNLSVEEYIERKIPREADPTRIKVITIGWQEPKERDTNQKDYSMMDAISATALDDLILAVDWFSGELERINASSRKLSDFEKLQPLEEQSIIPAHDHIDRLMRYQTTLQRQLSTTIGELIALTKTT